MKFIHQLTHHKWPLIPNVVFGIINNNNDLPNSSSVQSSGLNSHFASKAQRENSLNLSLVDSNGSENWYSEAYVSDGESWKSGDAVHSLVILSFKGMQIFSKKHQFMLNRSGTSDSYLYHYRILWKTRHDASIWSLFWNRNQIPLCSSNVFNRISTINYVCMFQKCIYQPRDFSIFQKSFNVSYTTLLDHVLQVILCFMWRCALFDFPLFRMRSIKVHILHHLYIRNHLDPAFLGKQIVVMSSGTKAYRRSYENY